MAQGTTLTGQQVIHTYRHYGSRVTWLHDTHVDQTVENVKPTSFDRAMNAQRYTGVWCSPTGERVTVKGMLYYGLDTGEPDPDGIEWRVPLPSNKRPQRASGDGPDSLKQLLRTG